jgi:hypothetical protein
MPQPVKGAFAFLSIRYRESDTLIKRKKDMKRKNPKTRNPDRRSDARTPPSVQKFSLNGTWLQPPDWGANPKAKH